MLANNAGGIFGDRTKTVDGLEKTFQINHLAPFLLTQLLMDTLIASEATVIQTSPSFATESDSFLRFVTGNPIGRAFLISPEKGAGQLVWLAEGRPGTDWISGTNYEKRRPAKRDNPQALDADLARQLWDRSEELLG